MEISTHGEPLTLHLPQFLLAQHHHGKPDIVLIEDSSVHILVPYNPGKLSKSLGKGNKKLYTQLVSDLEDLNLPVSFKRTSVTN